MRNFKFSLRFIAIVLILSSVSCSSGVPQNPTSPINIHEPKIEPSTYEAKTQEHQRINNCDGSSPTVTYTRSLKTEQTTFFSVNVEGGGLVKGTPIPGFLEAELEAKVTAGLGNSIVNTGGQEVSIPLQTPNGSIMEHTITWNETRKKGTIQVDYQNGTAEVGFEKVLKIELYDRTSNSILCNNSNGQTPLSTSTAIISSKENNQPQPTQIILTPTVAQAIPIYCSGGCWQYDTSAHTMTWTGPTDGTEDIWEQQGEPLQKIRGGYKAIISTSVPGEIYSCILSINGKAVKNTCGLYQISAGKYEITSSNQSVGGFRWCPVVGYGWRTNGGDCK